MRIPDFIQSPTDLRKLSLEELPSVANQLRQFLLESLNETGGHLAAGLGTIELTIALHYVFNTPQDKLIWDVGHQAYPHKILTQRAPLFHSIRQKDGLAPFPRREESPYDGFGVGHSSTSISAALGMTIAKQISGESGRAIAVIGDGAMTAGMAFEALNHAGDIKADLLVVLNDNDMSISGNVGALSNYFARILSSKLYTTVRKGSKKVLSRMPPVWEFARKTEEHLKGMIMPGTLFEELGFNYIGPVDGHDLASMVKTLQNVQALKGPQLLHVITQKGKGYPPAEADPIKYHGVTKGFYSPKVETKKPSTPNPTYSEVLGNWLCEMAAIEPRLVAITPAMCEGSGLVDFAKRFPTRYFDVGIAEQHSVTLAAGLACDNMKPVVAIYSTFLQRAYDQLIHDVAIQNLPVLFAIDRAGLVNDGPTHSGNFDLSYLRCIPNMLVMAPKDANECRHMLYTGLQAGVPAAVRYPRGCGPQTTLDDKCQALPIGKAELIQEGHQIALLSFGSMFTTAKKVADQLGATLVNMRFVKPLDEDMIIAIAKKHALIVTLEENVVIGGAGEGVSACLQKHDCHHPVLHFGLPDHFVEHGTQEEMLASVGLDEQSILAAIQKKVSSHSCNETLSPLESQ
ncbi:1-deoxy-D-xylulose-5-phosphate synthase [Candidatus Berkiella aquae]|uniref:1-deoxy-D-xylulose-5-phosphate synthase n=1 Tax=Candidatus Berkiella aquae TaxID=295108 RepID=A0A0Q9YMI3_9GAMM|nr:1-deoxy-D-xylulose-5-phosphate synthase [Candidatus Berkiella aquae]MCS5710344.1 1-deoxy-D-xylulose-5-phosphate synthase [Candidatus Berkiella aquae]